MIKIYTVEILNGINLYFIPAKIIILIQQLTGQEFKKMERIIF